jgi:gluconate 5-dehydrogenase
MSLEQFKLSGKTALVTGSTSGIGLAIARGLAGAGARVVLHGRDAGRMEAALADFPKTAGEVASVLFDVTDAAGVEAGIAEVEGGIGPIDILVNNAGLQSRAPLVDFELAMWERMIATNLTSAFLVGRTVARGMQARRRGKVINICSLMSEVGRKTIGPYTAAKGGVKQLTKAMAIEWAEFNIQVNGIGPGYFLTKLNTALADDPVFDGWLKKRTPAGRWGDIEELVGPAIFLASDASSFVTGQVLYVDGGMLASI